MAGAVRLLGGGGGLLGVNAQHAYEELNFLKLRVLMLNQENTALGKQLLDAELCLNLTVLSS